MLGTVGTLQMTEMLQFPTDVTLRVGAATKKGLVAMFISTLRTKSKPERDDGSRLGFLAGVNCAVKYSSIAYNSLLQHSLQIPAFSMQ